MAPSRACHLAAQRPLPRPLGRPPRPPVPAHRGVGRGPARRPRPWSRSCGPTRRGRPPTTTCGRADLTHRPGRPRRDRGPPALDQRRADGAVLLRHRPRDQAGARQRPAGVRLAAPRSRSPARSAAWWSPRCSTWPSTSAAPAPTGGASRWPPTSPSRSACWPCSAPGAGAAQGAAARPRDRRRRRRHRRHRRLLLDRPRRRLARRRRGRPASWSRCCAGPGSATCPSTSCCGVGIWLATFESGVHATIAGVALGLLAPARPFLPEVDADRIAGELSADQAVTAAEVRDISFRIRESIPVTERLEDLLHPWTSYLIVPLFALANAGDRRSRRRASATPPPSPITLGVVVGLVVGKLVGVAGGIALAVRLGVGPPARRRHDAARRRHGRHRRHRLHGVDLRGRPRLRRPVADRPGEARRAGGVPARRLGRQHHPANADRMAARDSDADTSRPASTGAAGPMASPPRSPR